jgi:hypothetical protein
MVCLRNICINTLHKGDSIFTNNNNNNNNNHHENTQPHMNSIVKLAAKITEDLSQLDGKNDTKQGEIQHTKENWERF